MSDLDKYFRDRGKDPAKLHEIPKTKKAFDKLTKHQLDALDALGEALEDDFKDGNHIGKDEAEVTPDEKLRTYTYAIH